VNVHWLWQEVGTGDVTQAHSPGSSSNILRVVFVLPGPK